MSSSGLNLKIISRLGRNNRLSQFLTLISFFITFVVVRIITHLQKAGLIFNQMGLFHIHHMVPGILLLLVTGFLSVSFDLTKIQRSVVSVFFGIGAALTIDEFALWLFLQDVYWAKQGRDSVDAIIVALVLLIIIFLVSGVYDRRHP